MYLIECKKCSNYKQYVGETENALHICLNGHRSVIRHNRAEKPVGAHFNLPEHSIEDLTILVVEKIQSDDTHLRRHYWIHKIHSLAPHGLNLDEWEICMLNSVHREEDPVGSKCRVWIFKLISIWQPWDYQPSPHYCLSIRLYYECDAVARPILLPIYYYESLWYREECETPAGIALSTSWCWTAPLVSKELKHAHSYYMYHRLLLRLLLMSYVSTVDFLNNLADDTDKKI